VLQEIVPDKKMLIKLKNSSSQLPYVIDTSVNTACESLNALSNLSEVDKFYWHFISLCCKSIQPDMVNLSIHSIGIDKLGKIFKRYCSSRNIDESEIPEEITLLSNTDVKSYFIWIYKIRDVIDVWRAKFLEELYTYDDISSYTQNLLTITNVAKAVYSSDFVFPYTDADLIKRYSYVVTKVSSYLIKGNERYGW